jgi:hypothetical protein
VSRVAKSSSSSSGASAKKRRRPNKKLVATLESLGDALDDIQAEMDDDEGAGGGGDAMDAEQAAQGKVRHKSLKSRPGALKRKEKLVKGEMERFGRSLAQLANIKTAAGAGAGAAQEKMEVEGGQKKGGEKEAQASAQSSATSGRWAALRGFISATMEQNPAFLGQT